ncbi:MAG: hypothetical protein JWM53_1484 [bacterium]|nr:hypothetical protein [bacterium]
MADFVIPPARHATVPLTPTTLARGLVIVSTLPNIRRHACIAQILQLDEVAPHLLPTAAVVHVSADEPEHWAEVDRFHPNVRAPGYSLHAADQASRVAFGLAFGVAVEGHARIAHGCFALLDGVVLAAEIPRYQMHSMDVLPFLEHLQSLCTF